MLISLLEVGLLLMGVGYNPTPIASGVKYTQNKTTRNEKIEIDRNLENSSTNYNGKQPFSIKATQLDSDQATYNYNVTSNEYAKRGIIQKQKRHTQTNVGRITTYTYQQRYLYSQTTATWNDNTTTYFYGESFKYSKRNTYTPDNTFDIATIQLDPYSNLFDTTAGIQLNIYLHDYLAYYDPGNGQGLQTTWYDVWTNITIFTTTENTFDTYIDIANWYSSQTVYQDMWNTLNNSTTQLNMYYHAGAVRYNADGTAVTTGDNRNNRTDEITIYIVPNTVNKLFVFSKPFILAPVETDTPSLLQTSTNKLHTQFMQLINPTINGYYIAGNINYEVVDIPGMMWEILTMPFTFISVAFNLTLFPGTPYQVNISNLFLVVFGIMVVIFILGRVKKFL